MDHEVLVFIEAVTAFALPALTGLLAYYMWLRHSRRLPTAVERELGDLREDNAQLRAELENRLAEIDERVNFVERRLVQPAVLPLRPSPPEVITPH